MPSTTLGPFRFDLTADEAHVLALRMRARQRGPWRLRNWWPSILGVGAIVAIVFLCLLAKLVSRDMAWALMLMGPIGFGAGQWLFAVKMQRASRSAMANSEKRITARLQQVSISFRHDAATVATASVAASLRWDWFVEAEVSQQLFLLWTEGGVAVVIPERVFRDEAERDAALAFARDSIGKAGAPPKKGLAPA